MSAVRPDDPLIAVLCSDLHLTLTAPACRAESDWLKVQQQALIQIRAIADNANVPTICAGDVFDRWNPPVELVNWALDALPNNMYAIPGQHDLPYHDQSSLRRSGFWTLCRANKIKMLDEPEFVGNGDRLFVTPFHWGDKLHGPAGGFDDALNVAVAHQFCWRKCDADVVHPGAPTGGLTTTVSKQLQGFDVAVFGDNHHGFLSASMKPIIFNCGTLLRRRINEIDYCPQIGLLYRSGHVDPYFLNTADDRFVENPETVVSFLAHGGLGEFVDDLRRAADSLDGADLRTAIRFYAFKNKIRPAVVRILNEIIDDNP